MTRDAASRGARPPHLICRSGTFHLRVRVPADLRRRFGMHEVRRSLSVHSLKAARPLALRYGARVMEAFEVARQQSLSKEQVRTLVQACFSDLATTVDRGFLPRTLDVHEEIAEQAGLAAERLARLEGARWGPASAEIGALAEAAFAGLGVSFADWDEGSRSDLTLGAVRALIEQQRLFLFRLEERLLPYTPHDPLFASDATPPNFEGAAHPVQSIRRVGPTLKELVTKYLTAKRSQWTAKTYRSREAQLQHLLECLGGELAVTAVTPTHVREFRDAVTRLRTNHHVGAGKSFASRQTDNEAHRIAPKTVSVIFESGKALFRWAKGDGYLASNPADGINYDAPKRIKARKSRRPFQAEELKILFAAPVFTGCRSIRRRFEAGSVVVRDARYWVPLLGLYTGMRLGEIVQLHLEDVFLDGPVPFIRVTDENSGEVGSGTEKHVKSHAGLRDVPLHPSLLTLGFKKFVLARRAQPQGARLFTEIQFGADGQPSTVFSKWFARLLNSVGLTDPALVFHSFRHTAEDAFRDALQPQYVIDRIVGHADQATSAGYGDGISLEVAAKAVRAMRLPFDPASGPISSSEAV